MKGGHQTLSRLEGTLDELAIEAQLAQEALKAGTLTAADVTLRMYRFAHEVETLAREGGRHLRMLQAPPVQAAAARVKAAA